jgi:hypothetical protein
MEGQASKKLKRTLQDRLAGQELVEKKFEKNNLNKKAKLEKKKMNKRLSKSASDGEMQTESGGGLLEAAGYERIEKKTSTAINTNTNTNATQFTDPAVTVNTQELVTLINNAQIERLRGVIKICLKYAMYCEFFSFLYLLLCASLCFEVLLF